MARGFVLIALVAMIASVMGKMLVQPRAGAALNMRTAKKVAGYYQPTGFVSYQYFTGDNCSGEMSYATGVAAGVCLISGTHSYSLEFSQNDCSDLIVHSYDDAECITLISSNPVADELTCEVYQPGTSKNSKKLICDSTPAEEPSIPFSAVVRSFYGSTENCVDTVYEYEATATGICLVDHVLNGGNGVVITQSGSSIATATFEGDNTCNAVVPEFTVDNTFGQCIETTTTAINGIELSGFAKTTSVTRKTLNNVGFTTTVNLKMINWHDYATNPNSNEDIIRSTIASVTASTTEDNIYDYKAFSTSSGVGVTFTIALYSAGSNTKDISASLNTAVSSGVFTTTMQGLAPAGSVMKTAIAHSSSSHEIVSNSSSSSSDDDDMSEGAIIGVAIGFAVAGVIIIILAVALMKAKKSSGLASYDSSNPTV